MSQIKEQNETPKKELSNMETSNLSDVEFNILVISMFNELMGRIDALSENFNKEMGNMKEVENIKNNWSETKKKLQGIKNSVDEAEDQIISLKDMEAENMHSEP